MATAVSILSYPFTSHLTYDPETDLPIYDRAVPPEVLRNINRQYFSDGVFAVPATSFQATVADSGLNIVVMPGACNINGTTGYRLEATLLTIDPPGGIARTDAVVLRWDERDDVRAIQVDVVKGTSTEKPTPTRTDTVIELIVAYVTVRASATTVLVTDIEDTRLNTDLCGLVRLPMEVPDTDPYFTQIQGMIDALREVIGGVIDGTAYMLKTEYAPDATASMENGRLVVVSANARVSFKYPLEFDVPEGYEPSSALLVDGQEVTVTGQDGEPTELVAAPGVAVSLLRRGEKVFPKSGGGASANYDVVGGTTQPEGKENRIWVNTDVAIPHYGLFDDVPTAETLCPWDAWAEGDVAVCMGGVKNQFVAYKGNRGSTVSAAGAYQYDGAIWAPCVAQLYISGTWQNIRTYLFLNGTELVTWEKAITLNTNPTADVSNIGTAFRYVTQLTAGAQWNVPMMITSDLIDVTDVETLQVNFAAINGPTTVTYRVVGLYTSKTTRDNANNINYAALSETALGVGMVELDISTLTGSYYVGVGIAKGSNVPYQEVDVTEVELL